ncbi:hypothetical protein PYW08_007368 [Mythimna loreyi]|uniref:Uncharacterized protein n=1 Tax=Mythimna loreyi TaxID=667449 RepID=A0ACC2RBU3_9NEOP|nr:hypothetical protein PYW08_007368 [Mythimna loreyi]
MAEAQDIVPGVERLTQLETVKIKQLTSSYEGNNFTVFDGEDVLLDLVEEYHNFSIFSFGRRRGFHMDVVDQTGKKVFALRRPGTPVGDKIQVRMGDALVATVRLKATLLVPVFRINDAQDKLVLRLKGKICDYDNFVLQTRERKTIGSINRKRHETVEEMRSRLDEYTISFPTDLEVHLKVAVIVACVLIDFRLHEFRVSRY